MTTRRFIRQLVFGVGLSGLIGGLPGCSKIGAAGKDPNVDYYTCTMHPSVKSQDPKGKCPICSMDLVPVMKKGLSAEKRSPARAEGKIEADPKTSEFQVPEERQQQIGVTYATAERRPLRRQIRSVGRVVADKARHQEFAARVEGYVQTLHVTSPGELIEEGQPLLTIYSPALSTAERELVSLLETRDRAASGEGRAAANRALTAARSRLEQWNITGAQIADLEKSRKPADLLTLRSPFKGVVVDVPVEQGRRVMPGDHLVDIADLSAVWVWADFFEDEVALLSPGQKVALTARVYPGETFAGELKLLDPFFGEASRTGRARIDLANPDLKLRPGMYLNVELTLDLGEGLTIPVSAVLPTGTRSLVFVGKGEGRLEPRFIQIGRKYGDSYEVLEGLAEGERVVASANFLIDAESKVQGAVKSFEAPVATGAQP